MTSGPFANAEEVLVHVEEAARELLEQVTESRVEALPSEAVRDLFRYLRPLWEEATNASQLDDETLRIKAELLKGVHIGLRAGIKAVPDITGVTPGAGAETEVLDNCGDRCWAEYMKWGQWCYDRGHPHHVCDYGALMGVLYPCIARCFGVA
jgi:hypothetical protein